MQRTQTARRCMPDPLATAGSVVHLSKRGTMDVEKQDILSKVPEVTLIFWITKILATTLGETGGDAVSMSMSLGYLVSTGIFSVIFIVAVIAQVFVKRFHPILYLTTIIFTTTLGKA